MTMISDRLLLERIRELKKAATPASLADAELLEELSSARAKLRVYREASGEPVAWMFHRAQLPRGTRWPWKLSFKQPPEHKGGFRIESVPLYASSQAVPEYPETLPCPVHLVPGLRLGKGCKTETLLIALQRRAEYYAGLDAMTPEERAKHYANIEAFKKPVENDIEQILVDDLRVQMAETLSLSWIIRELRRISTGEDKQAAVASLQMLFDLNRYLRYPTPDFCVES